MDRMMAEILYKDSIDRTLDTMQTSVEALAVCRRTIELIECPEILEEYDDMFSKWIDHYSKMISKMDIFELIKFLLKKGVENHED